MRTRKFFSFLPSGLLYCPVAVRFTVITTKSGLSRPSLPILAKQPRTFVRQQRFAVATDQLVRLTDVERPVAETFGAVVPTDAHDEKNALEASSDEEDYPRGPSGTSADGERVYEEERNGSLYKHHRNAERSDGLSSPSSENLR